MNEENNVSEIISHCNDSFGMPVMNTTIAHIDPATWYTDLYRICAVIINCFIFLTGMIGNSLVCIVVLRTRSMRTPTNCYLVNLAIADILVLLSATLPAITETFFQIDEWPFGRVMCSSLVFLQYLGVDASAMFITAFTVERYIAICHPLQSHAMCTVNRAKRIIAGIWIFGILYCSPWLGLTVLKRTVRTTGTVELCSIRLERHQYSAYYMADLMVFYVIPLLLSVVLYALIARNLFLTSLPKANGHHQNEIRKGKKKVISSKMQVVRMLAIIVTVFMTTWMPYRIMVVYNSFAKNKYMDLWFLLFSRTMVYINSAINPVLYNAMSVKFRRAFKKILTCGPSSSDGHASVYSEMHMDNDVTLQHTPGSVKRSPHTAGSISRSSHVPGSIKGSPNQRRVPLVRVGKMGKSGDVLAL